VNTDIFEGKWRQLKGEVRKRWGQLTDDEIEEMEGRQEKLIGKLQEKYGYTKVRAEQEVNDFLLELEK
jgi:uncharacterized protein YjbJ (UPF0337 family)